ncbi:MAG: ACT domain-containing protein [Planctomycetes bacterium]|nr:ACT domain-containing protein [Planctomycetota bacterium]
MTPRTLTLSVLPEILAVCRLGPGEPIPDWALIASSFLSLTRTTDELSVVCAESSVPDDIRCERDWRAVKVGGPLDFAETGILASLATPLGDAGISVFAVSTFDTDYLLVKQPALDRTRSVLTRAGHRFV